MAIIARFQQWRTIILAVTMTALLLASALWIFDVEPMVLGQLLLACVLGLMAIIAAAFVFSLLRVLIRRLLN